MAKKYDVVVSPNKIRLDTGHKAKLNVTATERVPGGASKEVSGASVDFACYPDQYATVDNNGVVTAVSHGITKVTATYEGVTAECEVEVS